MKWFYQTDLVKLRNYNFKYTRRVTSLVTIFHLIQHFNFKKILEVGYGEGETFALQLEITPPGSHLTAIDPILNLDMYIEHYQNSDHVKNKKIEFLEIKFEDFNSSNVYDFVNIDSGEGEFDRYDHLIQSLDHIHCHSILMLDNYKEMDELKYPTVEKFTEFQKHFIPFLLDGQAIYFHHKDNDVSAFLQDIKEYLQHQFDITTQIYKSFSVTNISPKGLSIDDPDLVDSLPKLLKTKRI